MKTKLTKEQKAITKQRAEFDATVARALVQFPNAEIAGMSVALAGGAKAAPLRATLVLNDPAMNDHGIVRFSNGQFGDHSLDLNCSDADRVLAHWSGYLENNQRFGPHSFDFTKAA